MAYGRLAYGTGKTVRRPVSNTSAISVGDLLKYEAATVGGVANTVCVTRCGAGDKPCGIAVESADAPTLDGDISVAFYCDSNDWFEYPPDAGNVSGILPGHTMDVGGAQSIDIDASTDDIVYCLDVNEAKNTLIVRFDFDSAFSGIV